MNHHVIFIEGKREGNLHSVGIHVMSGVEVDTFIAGPAGYVCTSLGYLKRVTYLKKKSQGAVLIKPYKFIEECVVVTADELPESIVTSKVLMAYLDTLYYSPNDSYTFVTLDISLMAAFLDTRMGKGRKYRAAERSGKAMGKLFMKLVDTMSLKRESPMLFTTSMDGLDHVGAGKADFLSNIGVNINECVKEEFVDKRCDDYWKFKVLKNPLLALRYIVISTTDPDREYLRLATPEKDIYNIGKVAGLTCYGVAKVKNLGDYTDVLINDVYAKVKKSAVILIDINAVYNKATFSALHQYHTRAIKANPNKRYAVNFIKDDVPLVEQVLPTNMTLRGFEQTTLIKRMLDKFINEKLDASKEEHFLDVTSQIYNAKGKIHAEVRSLGGVLNLNLGQLPSKRSKRKNIKIKYKLGNSLPTLSAIGQLGKPSTIVTFVAWYERGSNIYSHILIWDTVDGYAAFGNTDTNKLYI